ncbi:hypothetical protein Tco_0630232 [Tanacetum coccineum]
MPIDDECSSHNSPAADEGEQLDSIKRSNKTVESPSDVLGKRKRTDEGDGAAAASKIIPWQLHDWKYDPATASTYVSAKVDISTPKKKRRVLLKEVLLELEEDGKGYTDSESESASEDKNDSESEVASEDKNGSESESVNNHYVKNLLKDKNDTESEGGLDSIEGSNKTVESPSSDVLGKRKRTDEGDGAAASKIIPRQLHLLILEALELRQDMMQNKLQCEVKNDSESELDSYRAAALDKCEDRIRSLVKSFKKLKQLPHDWEYDPDTASTFVSAEADISTLPKMPPPKEKRMYFHYEINREVKKAVKGKNYTQLMKDLEYKIDGESESDNNHDVKNLLKDKNDTELKKDLEYKNDSESERVWNNCLDSINGSNNTVESPSAVLGKRKRTDEGDGAAASKIIPRQLHLLILEALELRQDMMQNKLQCEVKNDSESEEGFDMAYYSESELVSEDKNDSESDSDDDLDFQLKQCEDRIRSLAKRFKKLKQLPHDWEYDPGHCSNLCCAEDDISALPKMPPPKEKRWGCWSWVMDPNQKFPKTTDVPLDEEEKKIWMDFKEFDKDKLGLDEVVDFDTVHEHDIPLVLDNPIVSLTSKFAVTAFNEAIEMNYIHDIDIVKCKYLKMNESSYYFYITIEAFEERKRGVYDTKVRLKWDDGSKSLMHFVLTDRKPHVLKETTKLRTHPDSWQDGPGITHSGMRRRQNRRSICRGYDYRTPWGLLPNYSKSTIIFGSMSMDEQQEILDCVPFKVEKLPVKYLRVPLSSKRLSVNNCKCLIDKIKNRVFNWKNNCLSYAGRLQLIASVLESIHMYWAFVFLLPKTVIKDINKVLKSFLWNQGELSKGKAKVAWLNICRPKTMGGLGLKELEVWNECMIMKHLWNIASDKNTLWVKWVNTLKLKGRSIWAINEDASDSWGWKNILKMREEARKFMVMKIGNSEKAYVIFDKWSDAGILQNFITSRDIYNARRNENIVVKDIVVDGICQWPIEWTVKYPTLAMHQSIHLESDKEETRMGSEKIFSVSQAYYDLNNSDEDVKWNKLVWFS